MLVNASPIGAIDNRQVVERSATPADIKQKKYR